MFGSTRYAGFYVPYIFKFDDLTVLLTVKGDEKGIQRLEKYKRKYRASIQGLKMVRRMEPKYNKWVVPKCNI